MSTWKLTKKYRKNIIKINKTTKLRGSPELKKKTMKDIAKKSNFRLK